MSEETKKTAPDSGTGAARNGSGERPSRQHPNRNLLPKLTRPKRRREGWRLFNKKARELEAVKAKLDAAESQRQGQRPAAAHGGGV